MMKTFLKMLLAGAVFATGQNIYVDASAAAGGTGSSGSPYNTLEAAVTAANNLTGPVTIRIAAGNYPVSTPLRLQTPAALIGATVVSSDASGRLDGSIQANTATRIVASAPMTSQQSLLTAGKPGQTLSYLELSGLIFDVDQSISNSPVTPVALVNVERVSGMLIHDTIFLGTVKTAGLSTFASSGIIQHNYFRGLLAGAIFSGGYTGSAGSIVFNNNRATSNQNGLFLVGTSDGIPEPGYYLSASVNGNDLSGNRAGGAQSNGLRIAIKGNERLPGGSTAGATYGRISATISNNVISDNSRGVGIDAGFPYRTKADGTCDTRVFTGRLDLVFQNNSATGNTVQQQVTFARQTGTNAQFKYLHNSAFTVVDQGNAFGFTVTTAGDPVYDTWTTSCTDSAILNNTPILLH